MTEETETVETAEAEPTEGEVVVEVAPDNERPGKPQLSDEEVSRLSEDTPNEDEVRRYAKDAQKRIQSLHLASQEWKRRAVQSGKDVATATNLAQQLYQENQELKANMGRSEAALIEQAIQRAEAQLEQAKVRARMAYSAQDPDAIVAANEEVSRFVAEADRLRLLKPAAAKAGGGEEGGTMAPAPAPASAQPPPQSEAVRKWIDRNPWFHTDKGMRGFALGVHEELVERGVTELSDPQQYFGTIDRKLRETFPGKFKSEKSEPETPRRPVAVTGATRVNGTTSSGKRTITLSESQVRIARALGITNEQYAAQLIKDQAKEGTVQ